MDLNKVERRMFGDQQSRTVRRVGVGGQGKVFQWHRVTVRHKITCVVSQNSDYTLYQSIAHLRKLEKKMHNLTDTYMYIYQT